MTESSPAGEELHADPVLANSIRRYEARLAKDSASLAFAPLADLYRKAGRTQEAIALCRDGLKRYPNYETARLIMAKALLASGKTREAEAEFHALLTTAPDHVQAHQALADIYRGRGEIDRALHHVERVGALDRDNKEARVLLAAVKPTSIGGGEDPFRHLFQDDTFATMTFGGICLDQGCLDEAIMIYVRILRRNPQHSEARRRLDEAIRLKARRR